MQSESVNSSTSPSAPRAARLRIAPVPNPAHGTNRSGNSGGGISGGSSPTTMTSYAIPVRPRRIDSSAASRQGRRLLGMMMDARRVMVLALPPPVVP